MALNSEIIKNNIFRYRFAHEFITGKVFDHQSNNFTPYNSAKILLQNSTTEVYSCTNLFDDEIHLRRLDDDGSILFSFVNNKNLKSNFDSVISFENLNQVNIIENLDFYYDLLKDSGILIISVLNKRKTLPKNIQKTNEFTADDLREKISSKFKVTEIYSQRFKERSDTSNVVILFRKSRKVIAYFLKKIDKNRQFYIKHVQKKAIKFDSFNENVKKIPDNDFIPKKYNKETHPLFLILLCKKI